MKYFISLKEEKKEEQKKERKDLVQCLKIRQTHIIIIILMCSVYGLWSLLLNLLLSLSGSIVFVDSCVSPVRFLL